MEPGLGIQRDKAAIKASSSRSSSNRSRETAMALRTAMAPRMTNTPLRPRTCMHMVRTSAARAEWALRLEGSMTMVAALPRQAHTSKAAHLAASMILLHAPLPDLVLRAGTDSRALVARKIH